MKTVNPLKACAIAFSRFSAIPMPMFEWQEEDMAASMIFFPLVGALIGGACILWDLLCSLAVISNTAQVLILAVIPVVISGGIHLDGYMDVKDAVSSYGDRQKKLQILKDPHIGAFAVIHLAKLAAVFLAALSVIAGREPGDGSAIYAFACVFPAARALSVMGLLLLPKAKEDGTLYESAREAEPFRHVNLAAAVAWFVVSMGIAVYWMPAAGIVEISALLCSFVWYGRLSRREFGGITGDLAGYLVVLCEVSGAVAAAVAMVAV